MANYTVCWRDLSPSQARKYGVENVTGFGQAFGTHVWLHPAEGRQGEHFVALWAVPDTDGTTTHLEVSEGLQEPRTRLQTFPSRADAFRHVQTACFNGTLPSKLSQTLLTEVSKSFEGPQTQQRRGLEKFRIFSEILS